MIAGIVGRYRHEIFPIGGELIENAFRLAKKKKEKDEVIPDHALTGQI